MIQALANFERFARLPAPLPPAPFTAGGKQGVRSPSSRPLSSRRTTVARMSLDVGQRVHALKLAGAGQQVSSGGAWCEAMIVESRARGGAVRVHYFGWKPHHDEWIPMEARGSRLRMGGASLKSHIHHIPQAERDLDDESSVALPAKRPLPWPPPSLDPAPGPCTWTCLGLRLAWTLYLDPAPGLALASA